MGAGVRVGVAVGRAVGCGVGFADAVGAGVADGGVESDGDAAAGAESDGDGETAPESDGDAEADGDAPSEPDGDADGDADGDGLTVFGAIAKVAVEMVVPSQNGASAGQASTLARGATCTVYCVWPLGSSPYGCRFTTTPPGPVAHRFVPKSWSRTLTMEPFSPTTNSRSASRSSESTRVPAWSVTSK